MGLTGPRLEAGWPLFLSIPLTPFLHVDGISLLLFFWGGLMEIDGAAFKMFLQFFSQESSGRSLPAVTRRQKEPALGTASVSINSLQHLLAFCDVCNLGFLLIGPGDAATLRGDRLGPRVAGIHSRRCRGEWRCPQPCARRRLCAGRGYD